MSDPAETTVVAWVRLLRAHKTALSAVEAALKGAGLPPLAWYDVLLELERTPNATLRPFELQERLLLPQYGLSRLVGRMGDAGLVEQRPCVTDGRGQLIALTKAGRDMRRRMWRTYGPAMHSAVGDKLTPDERRALAGLLDKLVRP